MMKVTDYFIKNLWGNDQCGWKHIPSRELDSARAWKQVGWVLAGILMLLLMRQKEIKGKDREETEDYSESSSIGTD
ncbi:hypothetical protein BVC80_8881g16 [Macleaya cordata]|uniref:Uncharacterized protein n=1 Tax=Macleaya cordata TaxID=56857 RepID=A0A200Q7A8_MACCD|nr:hypothetical protein BVC80_8881g16 [Macleaya cordata]